MRHSDWVEQQNYFHWRDEQKRNNKDFLSKNAPELASGKSYLAYMTRKGMK